MKFAYEDLSDTQFENLTIFVCQHLLGVSIQGFADGADGGRDGKFVGTAELWPSTAAPWIGTTIIQAKHTNGYNRHFSETDFFNPDEKNPHSVLGKEIPRIKRLRESKQLDHYMLFANRRLAGNAESKIRKYISDQCNIPEPSLYLCGVEQLEILLATYPDIPKKASLDPVDSPLIVSPEDLAEVIEALAENLEKVVDAINDPPVPRMPYEYKNRLNNMTADYAKELRRRYLKETAQINTFLAAPESSELLKLYESVIEEFQLKIIAKRKDYQTFDQVLVYLFDLLFGRSPILRQNKHKRLTRPMLFYMYWICDIGTEEDAATK